MIKPTCMLLTCLALLLASTFTLNADTLFLKTGQRIFGVVVEQNTTTIVFDEWQDGTAARRQTYSRSDVTTLVVSASPATLQKLNPNQPRAYWELAELLLPQRQDPVTRELTIRLLIIALHYGNDSLRTSCFEGLIELARTADEMKRFRALAHVMAPDKNWLQPVPSQANDNGPKSLTGQRQRECYNAIRNLRLGNRSAVLSYLSNPRQVAEDLAGFKHICTPAELNRWAAAPDLKTAWIGKLLEIELTLASEAPVTDPALTNHWSYLSAWSEGPFEAASVQTVTEFDPKQSLFRNGQWTRPN